MHIETSTSSKLCISQNIVESGLSIGGVQLTQNIFHYAWLISFWSTHILCISWNLFIYITTDDSCAWVCHWIIDGDSDLFLVSVCGHTDIITSFITLLESLRSILLLSSGNGWGHIQQSHRRLSLPLLKIGHCFAKFPSHKQSMRSPSKLTFPNAYRVLEALPSRHHLGDHFLGLVLCCFDAVCGRMSYWLAPLRFLSLKQNSLKRSLSWTL